MDYESESCDLLYKLSAASKWRSKYPLRWTSWSRLVTSPSNGVNLALYSWPNILCFTFLDRGIGLASRWSAGQPKSTKFFFFIFISVSEKKVEKKVSKCKYEENCPNSNIS
jgi:hypothetical protein